MNRFRPLQQKKEKRELPLILISQIQRSGGSLLTQLMDGHPEIMVHHSELSWGKPTKAFWPRIKITDSGTEIFKALKEPLMERFNQLGYSKCSPNAESPPDVFPFKFDSDLQKKMFVKYWDEEKQKTVRKALDTFRKTYFKAWENYVYPEKPHYWAAFAARLSQMPGQIEMFFTDFPDGKFISIIREPVSWYASAKKHNPESYKSLDEAIFLWQSSVLAARNYKRI